MWNPTATIYQSNGITPVYTITDILAPIEGWPNAENPKNVTYENIRSDGELSTSGGNASFPITIRGRLTAGNYSALMTAFASLQASIVANTSYVLKIDTSISTTATFNVKRKGRIEIINTDNLNTWLYYSISFTALAF